MENLNQRQLNIYNFVQEKQHVGNSDILSYLNDEGFAVARITVVRDLDRLVEKGLLERKGKGRGTVYEIKNKNPLLTYFNFEKYFKTFLDERDSLKNFNFEVFDYMMSKSIFSIDELKNIEDLNNSYQKRIKKFSPVVIKKEFERLTIELSWKSSQIEGNTYSLLDTEMLILENKEAVGHSKEEAVMILNHKKVLDYIINNQSKFKTLTLGKLEDLHKILIKGLDIRENVRKHQVGITGTIYRPIDNEHQIKEALEKMIKFVNNKKKHPFEKALFVTALISYIQPFEDGNKRTARLIGNAILLANSYCPLSYRNVDEGNYKKAMILFYEQNSLRFFKEIFVNQFEFAVHNYFQ